MAAIKAYANCDYSLVVWKLPKVSRCRGFALFRRYEGQAPEVVPTWVGFEDEPTQPPGTTKPSTTWPIQKYMWADLLVEPGREVQYRVVPMARIDGDLRQVEAEATDWSEPVQVSPTVSRSLAAYFNRGIVASQWLARRFAGTPISRELTVAIKTRGNETRNLLAGELREVMLRLLDTAHRQQRDVYAALYELDDPELLDGLKTLGPLAHVVLAYAPNKQGADRNLDSRNALLGAHVDLRVRKLSGHIPHNKFLVLTDGHAEPQRVWTGSTNWSDTGLCTQVNNGLLIDAPSVARWYRTQWQALHDAGDAFPGELVAEDDRKKTVALRPSRLTTWFSPVSDMIDLEDARARIDAAQEGILFLMFNPGPRGTLLNDIIERSSPSSPSYDPGLYIQGVLNQDPSTKTTKVVLWHRGEPTETDYDVALPAAVSGPLKYWVKELRKLPQAMAMIHSKVVIIDPFGEKPAVITGSHNLGPKASGGNDENMLIIDGAPGLAADYAVNVIGVYNHYRWRFRMKQREDQAADPAHHANGTHDDWRGLVDNAAWQDDYQSGSKLHEINFWLGQAE